MAQQVSGQSRGWVWAIAAMAALALFLYFHSSHGVVTVAAAKVERHDLTRGNSTNGRVTPLHDFQAHAPLGGIVNKIYVHLGQQVQTGQVLVQMDDREAIKDVAAARANLATSKTLLQVMEQGGTADERLTASGNLSAANTQLQQDIASLTSLQALEKTGAASANEVALAQERLNAAKANVQQLQAHRNSRYSNGDISAQRAQVAQAQAALDAAEQVYSSVNIHSPFAGTVYALPISEYQSVLAGETLIQVADLTKLEIKAYFDEPEIGLLKIGQPVTVAWPAKPGQIWHGHIVQAPTTIIAYGGTRNVGECLISVDDTKGVLLPNTNVTVTVTEEIRNNVLSLPREALHTEGPSSFVYRIVGDRLVATAIEVGLTNLTRFEITKGLNEGDLVALGATTEADLRTGLRVKVQP